MNRLTTLIITIVAGTAILVLAIALAPGRSQDERSSPPSTFPQFRDLCDCLLVMQGDAFPEVTDSKTGTRRPYVSLNEVEKNVISLQREFSPSGRRSAWVSNQQSSIFLVDSLTASGRTVFSAPPQFVITGLRWSANDETLVVTLGPNTRPAVPLEAEPTRIIRLNTSTGETQTVIDVETDQTIKKLVSSPLFVTDDGQKVLFKGIDRDGMGKGWVWIEGRSQLAELPGSINFRQVIDGGPDAPWFASPFREDRMVFGYRDRITVVSLKDFSEESISIKGPSSPFYSPIGPDRRSLIYVENQSDGTGVELVHVDLITLARRAIVRNFSQSTGITEAVWTPNGQALILPENSGQEIRHQLVRTAGDINRFEAIEDTLVPNNVSVIRLVEKATAGSGQTE